MADKTRSGVDTQHPDYSRAAGEWQECRDAVGGPGIFPERLQTHLPMPDGFTAQSDQGLAMYGAYVLRAQFPEIMEPTVSGMVGIIHRIEAEVEMPESMQYLWEDCDGRGTPLEALHRRLTTEVLTVGRRILLVDAPAEGGEPYVASYSAESLINWDEDRSFYVLSEARLVREEFKWEEEDRWRVIRLTESGVTQQLYDSEGDPEGEPTATAPVGGGALVEIPLVVVGPRSLDVAPDRPPLLGLARCAFAIYRLDADMRHQLFMTGQETFFFIGVDASDIPTVLGAGIGVSLPASSQVEVKGPTGAGVTRIREQIADERDAAAAMGARLFDSKKGAESGEALRIRQAAQTATLISVALSSASGLERTLRHVATMKGEDATEIFVVPNLDFVDAKMTPTEAKDLMLLWQSGAISYETLYENLQRGGIASMERTAEDEQDLVGDEGGGDLGAFPEDEEGTDETGEVSDEELRGLFAPEMLED